MTFSKYPAIKSLVLILSLLAVVPSAISATFEPSPKNSPPVQAAGSPKNRHPGSTNNAATPPKNRGVTNVAPSGSEVELSFWGSFLKILKSLLSVGGTLLGIVAFMLSFRALQHLKKHHGALEDYRKQMSQMRTHLSRMDQEIAQQRVLIRSPMSGNVPIPSSAPASLRDTALSPDPVSPPSLIPVEPPWPPLIPLSEQLPIQEPLPTLPSMSSLIQALNAGDRQQLRDASKAELNITNDSENLIATGRSLATELEEVPRGGSFWLIELDNQYWLFPTDRTLKGFSASQPAKGLFHYQRHTIANPQLIEPALLESSDNSWIVRSLGVIGIP